MAEKKYKIRHRRFRFLKHIRICTASESTSGDVWKIVANRLMQDFQNARILRESENALSKSQLLLGRGWLKGNPNGIKKKVVAKY